MGNSSSSSGGGRAVWAQKLFKKENKKKDTKKKKSKARRSNSAPTVGPMYDTVADVPVYSVVDKTRKRNIPADDNVQYAEVEVVRRPMHGRSQKRSAGRQDPEITEYATINFIPQETARKRAITPPRKPVHDGGYAGQMPPYRRYNSVSGTLV
ncbi:uncharacterized protein ACNLHF_002503 isoform 1-T1 [Anomaloglossus baeobatrachus]